MSTSNLLVDQIVQKAVIEVDEEGTEAAAVTVATVVAVSNGPPPTNFKADHPFLFLLRELSTGLIIIQGKVNNPLLKSAHSFKTPKPPKSHKSHKSNKLNKFRKSKPSNISPKSMQK